MKIIRTIAVKLSIIACLSLGLPARSQTPEAPPKPKPGVVVLVAAVGDQIDFVRHKEGVGSHLEPFTRKRVPINGQALNFAVLRGLDAAIAEDEPESQRVLLQWNTPPELAKTLEQAPGQQRESLVLAALLKHLREHPQRAKWDRIEAIVPSFFFSELRGMGRKLSGIGIYVQPLPNSNVDFDETGEVTTGGFGAGDNERDGTNRTINPNTGATGKSSTFVAPYMYFQRITIDARTLQVLARKRHLDNVKYADPESTERDIFKQMSLTQMMEKLLETVERSAYKSVRGSNSEVNVSAPVAVPQAGAASAPR